MVEILTVTDDAMLERWLAVRNSIDPRPLTLAGYRAERTAVVAELGLLAIQDGRDVGASSVGWTHTSLESSVALLDAWVIADARRQGIGRTLVDRSIAFAREHELGRLWSLVRRGDDESLRFAQGYGLEVTGGGQDGALDLTRTHSAAEPTPATPPDGIVVTTLAERPDLERAVFDLIMLVRPEIPGAAGEPNPTYEAWQTDTTRDPGFVPGLSLIALDGDRPMAALIIYDNADHVIYIGMTAVHPDARRRGLARLVKVGLADRARAQGVTRIETFNDGANDGIRALNESLGYVYLPFMLFLKGPVPTAD